MRIVTGCTRVVVVLKTLGIAANLNVIRGLDLKIHRIAIIKLRIVGVPQMDFPDLGRSAKVNRERLIELSLGPDPKAGDRRVRATLFLVTFTNDTIGDVAAMKLTQSIGTLACIEPFATFIDERFVESQVWKLRRCLYGTNDEDRDSQHRQAATPSSPFCQSLLHQGEQPNPEAYDTF